MTESTQNGWLGQLSEFVAARFGLNFPQQDWPDLERRASSFLRNSGYGNDANGIARLVGPDAPPSEIEALANYLTVGETYFFREKRSLEILAREMVPDIISTDRGRGPIRIWSAGCATGEEPYSIAIELHETIPGLIERHVAIVATDLNTNSLRLASQGIYGEWSFRGSSTYLRSKYFSDVSDRRWAIAPKLKKTVSFEYFNLATGICAPTLVGAETVDIIFCRNVLMYFTPAAAARTIQLFHRSLAEGGWLVVSPVETSRALFSQFEAVSFPDAVLYRKGAAPARPVFSVPQAPSSSAHEPEAPAIAEISYVEISYDAASRLYEEGRFEECAEMLRRVLAADGSNVPAMLLLARFLADRGELDEASQWCERAIESDKLNTEAYCLLAAVLQERGLLEQTALLLRKAVYLDPRSFLAHFGLGNLALQQGKREESRKHFENTLAALEGYGHDEAPPQSGGLTAGRFRELVRHQTSQVEQNPETKTQ